MGLMSLTNLMNLIRLAPVSADSQVFLFVIVLIDSIAKFEIENWISIAICWFAYLKDNWNGSESGTELGRACMTSHARGVP